MRKTVLILVVILLLALIVACYPRYVEKPVKDGSGPLAYQIDPALAAPEYHSPLDWWRTHHMDTLNRGDQAQSDCLYCHQPQTSCNQCHAYAGAAEIVAP
jgi:hypothetical protein